MNITKILTDQIESLGLWEKQFILKRNQFLKGNIGVDTSLYFIVSGSMRIYVEDGLEEHTIRFAYKDSFIAVLDSFISEEASDLYVQALKKTEIKSLSKSSFMNFIENYPENRVLWYKILGLIIFQQMERERDLLTSSPEERYLRVLKRSPQLFQEIPKKYIASYLRMTPETLSRINKS